jgi:hypothetical protein
VRFLIAIVASYTGDFVVRAGSAFVRWAVPLRQIMILRVALIALLSSRDDPEHREEMERNGKRTVQVNVRLSTEDFNLIKRAANVLWPDAVLTKSGILLGMAKIAARDVLKGKSRKNPK